MDDGERLVLIDSGTPAGALPVRRRPHRLERGRALAVKDFRGGEVPLLPNTHREAGFVVLKTEPAVQARKEPFFVRPYREGDEAQILPLFRQSFFVERSPERFRWEYRENPAGNERIRLSASLGRPWRARSSARIAI